MNQSKSQIAVDDLEVGRYFTVVRNKHKIAPHPEAPESDYLKGSVLRADSINLPYVLVTASDPRNGQWKTIIDVRIHQLGRVSEDYIEAVQASAEQFNPIPATESCECGAPCDHVST